jgi:hypothetical protein
MRDKNTDNILLGNTERKRPLARSRHRWKDNIKTDLEDIKGVCGFD